MKRKTQMPDELCTKIFTRSIWILVRDIQTLYFRSSYYGRIKPEAAKKKGGIFIAKKYQVCVKPL